MICATGLSLGLLAVVSYNPSWEKQAQRLRRSLAAPSHFAGFVNQSELVGWYLAADILVLPSRQAGETWGLVANEALQAGCGVVV